jgi:transposase InsO family protein
MPKNVLEERLRWVLPIVRKEVKLKDIAIVCPYGKRTIERWVAAYKKYGEEGLVPKSTQPKSNPNETPIRIRERALELRKETNESALKIHWKLEKENVFIHERTIGKFLKKDNLTRKYRIRKIQYKYIKAVLLPGELIEIDIKYVPGRIGKRRYYQFTAIDCASRWRYLKIYDEQTGYNAILFLSELLKIAPFQIKAIKTDNGSCFTNRYMGYLRSKDPFNPRLHALDIYCNTLGIEHYLIDPGKPAQNGKVERSHRSDQESFYDRNKFNSLEELEYKLKLWNMYYNNLEHCGLGGKSPNEVLQLV